MKGCRSIEYNVLTETDFEHPKMTTIDSDKSICVNHLQNTLNQTLQLKHQSCNMNTKYEHENCLSHSFTISNLIL